MRTEMEKLYCDLAQGKLLFFLGTSLDPKGAEELHASSAS